MPGYRLSVRASGDVRMIGSKLRSCLLLLRTPAQVNTADDAQQLTMPLLLVVMLCFRLCLCVHTSVESESPN